jgi:outer membrane protein
MRPYVIVAACALVAGVVNAQTPASAPNISTKIGIINIQDAIVRTAEGQKAAKALQDKFAPRQSDLEKGKRELADLQAQFNKGRSTMSEEARNNLIRQIDAKNKSLTRDNDDAAADYQQEEGKLINGIGQKMMGVIDKYAKEKGYAIILDISSPQSPVLYAINTVDITSDIVTLYDKSAGEMPAAPAAAPKSSAPVTRPPASAAPRPAAPAPVRPPSAAPPKP